MFTYCLGFTSVTEITRLLLLLLVLRFLAMFPKNREPPYLLKESISITKETESERFIW